MRLTSTLLVIGSLVSAAPLAAQADIAIPDSLPPGVTPHMVRHGRQIFEGAGGCANCHGEDAHGSLGPDLTDDNWWHAKGNYLEVVSQILVGVPSNKSVSGVAMAPKGGANLTDHEVQSVAAFVWKLSHPESGDSFPPGVTPAMVGWGGEIFHGKGGCDNCHAGDARGRVGPNLTDEVWLHAKGSYLAIVQQILTGVPAERSRGGIAMPPRGGSAISDADVQAVAAYIWVISRRP